jgi:hypothetical protein
MKGKLFFAVLLAGLCSAAFADLTPEQVSFPYDPNLVSGTILDAWPTDPNKTVIYDVYAKSQMGLDVTLTVTVPNPQALVVTKLPRIKDPDGKYRQPFRILWTPPAVQAVYYVQIEAKDRLSRIKRKTVLVLVSFPSDAPELFPGLAADG